MDEYTWLVENTVTYHLETTDLDGGRLVVGREAAPVPVDYQLEPHKPPYLGRTVLAVDAQTRVWKGDRQITLRDLASNDALLVNLTGGSSTSIPRCTDIWVGADTHHQVTDKQRAKYGDRLKQLGAPGWIESMDGRKITMVFFAAYRDDFAKVLNGDPWGKGVTYVVADDQLKATTTEVVPAGFANHLPEGDTFGAHGCSGVKWVIETAKPESYAPGQVLRVFKESWRTPAK